MKQSNLLEGAKFQITIKRLCQQLIENHGDFSDAVLIGIQPRGTYLAKRIQKEIKSITGVEVQLGILDITFYRDDFRMKGSSPLAANSTFSDVVPLAGHFLGGLTQLTPAQFEHKAYDDEKLLTLLQFGL